MKIEPNFSSQTRFIESSIIRAVGAPFYLRILEVRILLQFSFESILEEISQLLIIFAFFIALADPYLDSETFECVPVGLLHEPDTSNVLLNAWNVASGDPEDQCLPSLLEDSWLSDPGDLNSELSSILVLGVFPLWVDASLEHHDGGHLVQTLVTIFLLEPSKIRITNGLTL